MNRCLHVGLVACCLLAAGCSGETYQGPELIAVDGIVTLDAQPLADAELLFIPTGNTLGQGAVGRTDAAGRFKLAGHHGHAGAAAGSYRVIITKCLMPDGNPCPVVAEVPPMDSAARQILLPRYSSIQDSQLTATVSPGKLLEFHLSSKPERRRRW